MNENNQWYKYPYCQIEKFCPPYLFAEHMGNCEKRPASGDVPTCPVDYQPLTKEQIDSHRAVRYECKCGFKLDVLEGGKHEIR